MVSLLGGDIKKKRKKACYLDKNGDFKCDQVAMQKWYTNALKHIEEVYIPEEDIPFIIFLMGCETALRCQEQETIH